MYKQSNQSDQFNHSGYGISGNSSNNFYRPPVKRPFYKRKLFIFTVIIVIAITAFIIQRITPDTDPAVEEAFKMEKEDFMADCREYDYNEILKNPDRYLNKPIKVMVNIYEKHRDPYCFISYAGPHSDFPYEPYIRAETRK